MQFIFYVVRINISIISIIGSLWFLDNVLISKGENNTKNNYKIIFSIIIFLMLVIDKKSRIIPAIICYYIILFIYGICIKAEMNLLNFFWIIRSMADCLSIFFISYILGALVKGYTFLEFYYDNSFFRQIIFLLSVLFRIINFRIQIKQKHVIENLSNNQILISSFIFIIVQIFLIITLKDSVKIENPTTVYDGFLVILLNVVNVFFYKILIFLSTEIEEKYFLEMSVKQTELEERYIKEISQIYTDIRSWKHDYRNNINVICNLAIANKHDELFRYIKELDEEIKVAEAVIYTEVFIIDSVITSKYLYGNGKGIKFNINTGKIKKGNISDFDINIILSNLLDNAIEGALKSYEKTIYINIFEKNNNIVFKIKNTCDGNVKKIDGNYITTKEGSIHGLGINRVKNTINKYNGTIYIDNKNNIFESKVIIPIL